MSPYIADIAQFAFKQDSAEGTAEVIAAADCKNLMGGIDYDPDLPFFTRDVASSAPDQYSGISGGLRKGIIRGRIPMKGSGAAGTAPATDAILEAIGFLGVNSPATSETYKPTINTANKSLTAMWKVARSVTACMDFEIFGARGRASMEFNNGMMPIIAPELEGVWVLPVASTLFTGLTEEATNPVALLDGNFVFNAVPLRYRNFTINVENDLEPQDDAGDEGSSGTGIWSMIITKQRITFSIDPKLEVPGTWDFFTRLVDNTEHTLTLPNGATAGNIFNVTAPKMQFTEVKIGERGYLTADCVGQFNRNTDANPGCLVLTFT